MRKGLWITQHRPVPQPVLLVAYSQFALLCWHLVGLLHVTLAPSLSISDPSFHVQLSPSSNVRAPLHALPVSEPSSWAVVTVIWEAWSLCWVFSCSPLPGLWICKSPGGKDCPSSAVHVLLCGAQSQPQSWRCSTLLYVLNWWLGNLARSSESVPIV